LGFLSSFWVAQSSQFKIKKQNLYFAIFLLNLKKVKKCRKAWLLEVALLRSAAHNPALKNGQKPLSVFISPRMRDYFSQAHF